MWADWFLVIWNIINHFGSNDRVIFKIYEYFLEHFSIGKKQPWLKILSYCFYRILFFEPFSKEEINDVNFRPIIITNLLIHRFYKHYFSQDKQIQIEKPPEEHIQQNHLEENYYNNQSNKKEIIVEKQLLDEKPKVKKTKRELKEEEEEQQRKKMEERMKYLDYEPKLEVQPEMKSNNPRFKNYFEKVFKEENEWENKQKPKEPKIKNIEIPDTNNSNNPIKEETFKIKKKEISLDNFPSSKN